MSETGIVDLFDGAKIIYPEKEVEAKDAVWYRHPDYEGVFLKDLVQGKDTGGQFSCHVVKIEKECEVGCHSHDGRWEFNEAIEGDGVFIFGDKEVRFGPGYSFATPPGVSHTVVAEGRDLYILAKFVPAL